MNELKRDSRELVSQLSGLENEFKVLHTEFERERVTKIQTMREDSLKQGKHKYVLTNFIILGRLYIGVTYFEIPVFLFFPVIL